MSTALAASLGWVCIERAHGQEIDVTNVYLSEITVVPSKVEEDAVEALASVSVVTPSELEILQPTNTQDIFFGMPNVTAGVSQDTTGVGTSFNIRGLQDFGRVAVILDGARNNFQRNDHGATSTAWIEPEMINEVTVVRGPVSNLYGSGAIGGVVVFETKTASDFLAPGERAAGSVKGRYETNGNAWTATATGAARFNDTFDVIGNVTYRESSDYKDGDGNTVPYTHYDVLGGLAKTQIAPGEDHLITLGWIGAHDNWNEEGIQDVTLDDNTFTGKYEYSPLDNPWVALTVSGFYVDTKQSQTQLVDTIRFNQQTGAPVLVPVGNVRDFKLNTGGFDGWNTSTFDTGPVLHTLTFGGDWYRDDAQTDDSLGGAGVYNPSGERSTYGAYVQNKVEYSNWFEAIGALRWDGYDLRGDGNVDNSASRVSPRLSVGVKPFEDSFLHGVQIYGTYAEGYRSPSIIETLMIGLHPAGVLFPFLPNPDLIPETAKTWEVGLNFARDNVLYQGDGVRMKAAWFHNDVDDYIGLAYLSAFVPDNGCFFVPTPQSIPICAQYQNFDTVQIHGFELEAVYDTGWFFAGLQGAAIQGVDTSTIPSTPLYSIPPNQVTGRVGFRALDEALVIGGEVQRVMPYNSLAFTPSNPFEPTIRDGYTLVNLFGSYEANDNLRIDVRLENLFDVEYANYMNISSGTDVFERGFNAKVAATLRFGVVQPSLVGDEIVVRN